MRAHGRHRPAGGVGGVAVPAAAAVSTGANHGVARDDAAAAAAAVQSSGGRGRSCRGDGGGTALAIGHVRAAAAVFAAALAILAALVLAEQQQKLGQHAPRAQLATARRTVATAAAGCQRIYLV